MIIRSETPHEIVTWFCYLDFDCHCCCASDARTVAEISDRGCTQKSRRQAKSRGSSAANCRWQAGSSGSPLVDLKISTFDQEAMRPEVVNPSRFVLIAKENGITINPANNWTLAKTLEDMDKAGTATAITSITTPGLWFGNAAVSRRLSRECNEYSAKIIRDYPGLFGLFAALPLPDIDGSLKEIEYALDVLKADGICMHTVYQDKATGIEDRFLGHPMFDPIHQELNRRKAIVYTQPKEADC